MQTIAARWKRFGYRRINMMLQREGIHINHKKSYRLYKEAGLQLKRKLKRKTYAKRGMTDRSHLLGPNGRWPMDFVSDTTAAGRKLRIFTLIDEVTRECIALEVDTSITGQQVSRYLNKAIMFRGKPKEILTDNGPEYKLQDKNAHFFQDKNVQISCTDLCMTEGRPYGRPREYISHGTAYPSSTVLFPAPDTRFAIGRICL